jgi:hypothetical protein
LGVITMDFTAVKWVQPCQADRVQNSDLVAIGAAGIPSELLVIKGAPKMRSNLLELSRIESNERHVDWSKVVVVGPNLRITTAQSGPTLKANCQRTGRFEAGN